MAPEKRTWWRDAHGCFRVIVVAEGWAMCRRKGSAPFLLHIREFESLTRVRDAEISHG